MRVTFAFGACLLALLMVAGSVGRAQVTPPATASTQPAPTENYEVRIEGGDLALSGLHVLKTLSASKVLPVSNVDLGKETHTSVCDVFIEETNLPGGCSQQLIDFATAMNRFKESPNRLADGTTVYYPKADFEPYTYAKQYNLSTDAGKIALEDDKRKAGQYMSEEYTKSRSGMFIQHFFKAYKLKFSLPIGKASDDVIRRLNSYPGVFVVKEPTAPAPPKPPGYSMSATIEQIPVFCTGDGTPEEAYALKYIGVAGITPRDCAKQPSGACAEVVILDQAIAKNPEIDGVVGATGDGPGAQEPFCTDPQQLGVPKFHSTHMAGIIAAKENGRAFIGLHPGGRIEQGWADEASIANEVNSRNTRDSLQVYLFARSWRLDPPWAKGDHLVQPSNRTENIVASRIHSLQENLWIVAAGQPSADGLSVPTRIDDQLNLGPMNSGDQENVLVVGGCTDCGSGKPRFWNQSHFSRTFVHVAAPADLIVSTATGGSYTWAQGTSQAAAFVAGVASMLVSEWPNTYKFASRVKERLQYTATPFPDRDDREKLAAGVINPALAMKDPNKNYIDTTDPGKGLEELTIDGWCAGSLTVLTPSGNLVQDAIIGTKRIHRIVQMGSGPGRQWAILSQNPWDDPVPGVVRRIGPGIPTAPKCEDTPNDSRPLLKSGPRLISLKQIENLLVKTNLPSVVCGCPKPKP